MTGEPVPASDSPGPAAAPRLRASHADRDRVVEVLRVAAGDGRLTLLLVIRPGIVVDADDLKVTHGDVKIRHVTDPHTPLVLRVVLGGRIRGGDVVARLPYRTFSQWLHRQPRPYRELPG